MIAKTPQSLPSDRRRGGESPVIANLTYQSRAAESPSPSGLAALLENAKARNRSVGVTGMLLFNEGSFFQWLEGPSDGVSQIWASIQTDPRHGQIELLGRDQAPHRMFSEWDMRFVSQDQAFETVCDPRDLGRALPAKLIDAAAKLAIDQQAEALQDGLEEVLRMGFDVASVYSDLVEPAAHRLGDWWLQDLCTSSQIAIALRGLQTAGRRLASRHMPAPAVNLSPRHILIAPPPAEPHMLGLTLVSDLYRQAGWFVDVAFSTSDEEIGAIVRNDWFDVLTLAVSDVFTRFDRINALANTIRKARDASLNSNLLIMVGGRTFAERPDLAGVVGADASYANLAEAVEKTDACLKATKAMQTIN